MEVLVLLILIALLAKLVYEVRHRSSRQPVAEVTPEVREAFDTLLVHLDRCITVGRIWYTWAGDCYVVLDGVTYVVRPHAIPALFAADGSPIGVYCGRASGWEFRADFWRSFDGKTIYRMQRTERSRRR